MEIRGDRKGKGRGGGGEKEAHIVIAQEGLMPKKETYFLNQIADPPDVTQVSHYLKRLRLCLC